jgi:DNA mismatch endonuclease, patch repair protein
VADVFSKLKRSEVMSHVRGRGNKSTELIVMKLFQEHQITGWRRHHSIFGNPDFSFIQIKLAIFVDGCFWHGCPKHASQPTTNVAFWRKKLARNKVRDRLVNRTLRQLGWTVLRIWQHELRRKNEHRCVRRICSALARAKKTFYSPLKITSRW